MFNRTQKSEEFLKRTGNQSTKGSRRGFYDIGIVVDAKEFAERPESVKKQLLSIKGSAEDERIELEKFLMPLRANPKNWRRNVAYKYKGREHIFSDHPAKQKALKRYLYLGEIVKDCQEKLTALRCHSPLTVPESFMNEAEKTMDKIEFERLKNAAIEAVKSA